MKRRVFRVGHFFCGSGIGARGFQRAKVRLDGVDATFKTIGGIDNDPKACADFEYLTDAPALCADMHTVQPADIRRVLGDETPDAIFTSPPCKGFSGLLGEDTAKTPKYQKLNELVFRGLHLMCETWDEKPGLIVLENVPRIQSRGAKLLEQVRGLLRSYGYLFHESTHDCGVIGGLAQHRKRYLMVARLPRRVSNFVYQPPKKRVLGCGEVLGLLPMPHLESAGAMHKLPRLNFVNWMRLAIIPAGGDWRDLPRRDDPAALAKVLALKTTSRPNLFGVADWQKPTKAVTGSAQVSGSNGVAAVSDERGWGGGPWGVLDPKKPAKTVAGASRPSNGPFSVVDERVQQALAMPERQRFTDQLQMRGWKDPARTVTGSTDIQEGAPSVVDPRVAQQLALPDRPGRHESKYRVTPWQEPAHTVTGTDTRVGSGAPNVVDPRTVADLTSPVPPGAERRSVWARWDVRGWDQPARTVDGPGTNGGFGVVDVRGEDLALGFEPRGATKGPYGVMSWEDASAAVVGSACHDNGPWTIADPRKPPPFIPVIASPHDGHWHRPMTTLELGALQGLPATWKGKPLVLAGKSSSGWRERIGNGVPEGAGCAIGETLLLALLASALGTWTLGGTDIWVQNDDGNDLRWDLEPMGVAS